MTPHLTPDRFNAREAACDPLFNRLKAREEKMNRIFIEIYGHQDEPAPEIENVR